MILLSEVSIPGWEKRLTPIPHIVYKVHLTGSLPHSSSHLIYKRFSHFWSLDQSLRSCLGPESSSLPPFPSKTFGGLLSFLSPSYDSPDLLEFRRSSLESYLDSILHHENPKLQSLDPWTHFFQMKSSSSKDSLSPSILHSASPSDASSTGNSATIIPSQTTSAFLRTLTPSLTTSPEDWLQTYNSLLSHQITLKRILHQKSQHLVKGETKESHSLIFQGQKVLSQIKELLESLNTSLRDSEFFLGSGEFSRRKQLLNSISCQLPIQSQALMSLQVPSESPYSSRRPSSLFQSKGSTFNSSNLEGSDGSGNGGRGGGETHSSTINVSQRSFRGPPFQPTGKETEESISNSNSQLLTLQTQTLTSQDSELNSLSDMIRKQKELGLAIGNEIELQNSLLGESEDHMTGVGNRMKAAGSRLNYVAGVQPKKRKAQQK